jgi:DNA modification methylase
VTETFLDGRVTLHCGDVRAMLTTIPESSIDCVVTSPPYWGLRNYFFDNAVVMRDDLSPEERQHVEQEIERLGIKAKIGAA